MIRAIDASGIINEIGIGAPSPQTILNPGQLSHTQIATLAHHLTAQLTGINPQHIVSLIANIGVAFL